MERRLAGLPRVIGSHGAVSQPYVQDIYAGDGGAQIHDIVTPTSTATCTATFGRP